MTSLEKTNEEDGLKNDNFIFKQISVRNETRNLRKTNFEEELVHVVKCKLDMKQNYS